MGKRIPNHQVHDLFDLFDTIKKPKGNFNEVHVVTMTFYVNFSFSISNVSIDTSETNITPYSAEYNYSYQRLKTEEVRFK